MLVPLIVIIYHLKLKHLLMRPLAFILLCEFQISIYIMAISNLEDVLMM